jgi:lysylphosphatidylglycerol synthetase-like protein (DUF2156 family)
LNEEGDVYMNFDTKYLVRWGIPGWILIMILGPFIFIHFNTELKGLAGNMSIVALGAILTIIGVPLGYLLNQIHHSITWVFVRTGKFRPILNWVFKKDRESWNDYFSKELKLDDYLKSDGELRTRYRYLLSKKHELGGLTVSLFVTNVVILFTNIILEITAGWSWIYLVITMILLILIWLSRNYSSRNIEIYFSEYLKRANESFNKSKK